MKENKSLPFPPMGRVRSRAARSHCGAAHRESLCMHGCGREADACACVQSRRMSCTVRSRSRLVPSQAFHTPAPQLGLSTRPRASIGPTGPDRPGDGRFWGSGASRAGGSYGRCNASPVLLLPQPACDLGGEATAIQGNPGPHRSAAHERLCHQDGSPPRGSQPQPRGCSGGFQGVSARRTQGFPEGFRGFPGVSAR